MTAAHGPLVIRKRLGWALKQLRVARHRQLSEIAKLLEVSASKLSRLETGQVEPKFRDVRDLLEIYGASDTERDRILGWAHDAKAPGWWEPLGPAPSGVDLNMLISLEAESRAKSTFSIPISGLLQTEDYARLLLTEVFAGQDHVEIERMMEIRMGRQNVIEPDRTEAPPLELHVLLDEVALHRCADEEVLRAQIGELIRRGDQPNITLQILPFRAGWTSATSTFSVFTPRHPETDWPMVNVEGTENDVFIDTPQAVADYQQIWQRLLDRAMSPDDSRRMLDRRFAGRS
jgi:transcriptional regulator with XRE-family HTH domain